MATATKQDQAPIRVEEGNFLRKSGATARGVDLPCWACLGMEGLVNRP